MMPIRKKCRLRALMGVATALAGAITSASGQLDEQSPDTDRTTTRQPPSPATGSEAGRIDAIPLDRLNRTPMQVKKTDAFNAKSWYVRPPPRPAPPPPPPPPPSAPPLPFTFLGKIQEPGGELTIFLAGENRVFLVREGETIDNTYHVDGIEAGRLALTYMPLQIKQYLNMGDGP